MSKTIRKFCSVGMLALLLAAGVTACSPSSAPIYPSSSTASIPNAASTPNNSPSPSSFPSPSSYPRPGSDTTGNTGGVTVSLGASRNWSGYAASNGTFTSVTGTWRIPQVSPNGHAAGDATWIGIGGVTSHDLIQSGTQNIISNSGQVSTSAFFELLPAAPQTIPVGVQSGDSIVVSITELSSNQWQISFQDTTNGQSYHTTVSYSSSLSSVEWIEEAPSKGRRTTPLDNFGTVQFSSVSATKNGNPVTISASNAQPITMSSTNSQVLATASSLGSDGASFTVTRSSTISSPPNPAISSPSNPDLGGSARRWRRHGFGIEYDR